ncbi:hypothetical protein M5K25_007634 [Dendrobium thyrsiflorum]|uniref:Transcription repressor n=1 Tax=Dendrobium thyrsiflorum TaxID=117978 RepID=A0ABD0VM15_DENTH
MTPLDSEKSKIATLFSFTCGCRNPKAVSVSALTSKSSDRSTTPRRRQTEMSSSSGDTLTTASSSIPERDLDHDEKNEAPATLSDLLRELRELEQSVKACGIDGRLPAAKTADPECWRKHRRSRSEGRVAESVAVTKDSADPLGDFRQSMLQMIVEKEIVGEQELRELLLRFLALNSPRYHGIILRAFGEIWNEVFSGYENTPDFLGTIDTPVRCLSQRTLPHRRRY